MKMRTASDNALTGSHPCGEAGDGLTRSQASYVIGLAVSVWSCLEVGMKRKKADSSTSSNHSGLFASEAVFWLPRLVAVEVMGQLSIVIRSLASVCLDSQSLREQEVNH